MQGLACVVTAGIMWIVNNCSHATARPPQPTNCFHCACVYAVPIQVGCATGWRRTAMNGWEEASGFVTLTHIQTFQSLYLAISKQ